MIKKSEDGKVKFYDRGHKYKLGKRILESGTSFLKPYFQPFDAKEIARKLAKFPMNKQHKRGVRYWLAKWKEDAAHGTRVHSMMENFFYALDNRPCEVENIIQKEARDNLKFSQGADWLSEYWDKLNVLEPVGYPEYIVYNDELGIAGQIDLLVEKLDIQTGEPVYDLIDWKSNKKIDVRNYEGKPCFKPLDRFESSTYFKYQLQLSLYAYLLGLQGKKIGRLILVHLKEDKAVEIEMEYRPDLIEKLLDYREEENDEEHE